MPATTPGAHDVRECITTHAELPTRVEIYFSVVQRKALTPDDFRDFDDVTERFLSFQDRYNGTAQPFDWTFTRDDLNQLLTRLGHHDHHAPPPLAA
jgi:hypothetical protein